MVKRIAVILLLLLYGSTNIGATVHLHYCMNELVGWSLWHKEKEKCGRCGMKEDKTGCCKDEYKLFKLKADHQISSAAAVVTFNLAHAIVNLIPDFNFRALVKIIKSYTPCHAPPDIGKPSLYVLNCTFLI